MRIYQGTRSEKEEGDQIRAFSDLVYIYLEAIPHLNVCQIGTHEVMQRTMTKASWYDKHPGSFTTDMFVMTQSFQLAFSKRRNSRIDEARGQHQTGSTDSPPINAMTLVFLCQRLFAVERHLRYSMAGLHSSCPSQILGANVFHILLDEYG